MQSEGSSSEITKALTAYQHFQKMKMTAIKEELVQTGQDSSLGQVMQALSAKWKALSDSEREEYETLASKDKERYLKECQQRDEEYLRLQEERRKANTATETESRMRNSTMARSDASALKADAPKRKREVSEQERKATQQRKQAKLEEERAIEQQHSELRQSKADQAEARLKYLLSQSDIFSHFGLKGSTEESSSSRTGTGSSKVKSSDIAEDLDDDEIAMLEEENESEEDGAPTPAKPAITTLTRQPNCIVGGKMRPYQLEGLNWMVRLTENGINGILADEMGLGKTLQSISVLAYLLEYRNISGPHLIIVPKSTLSNWCNEFTRWCPSLRTVRFHGNKEERAELVETVLRPARRPEDRDWDVLVTTYEVSNMERGALAKIAWRFLIIDEAHRLKNEASQFSQNVRHLNTEHRLLLTGTPLQNNLHELWALLNFLLPDVFASSEQFDEWFNLDVDDKEAKQRMIGQLHKILRPFMLRRLKVDVEKSLPPKTETILFTGLSVTQKAVYRQVLMRDIDQINTGFGGNSSGSRTAILNIVMQLRKCCNHPYLFPGVEDRNENPFGEHLITNCGKMVLLDKLLGKLFERKHRVLIFSQMTRMLDILEDYCAMREYKYCRIDGNTSYEDREDRIEDYNSPGSDKFIFLLSTRAGGLGINLQTADTVIIYDSDWNPQADLQAQDRCHRIGQTKQVHVYRLVTDDTVEVKVVERAQQKLKLDAMVVQQGRLQDKEKKMSKNELLDTLRFGADKIFRTKDSSSITDEDIDILLEMGRKRTEELNEKLQAADKGDLYDFRLDGNTNTQVFEGKDYRDKNVRDATSGANFGFIDTGPRERKPIVNYSEQATARGRVADGGEKKQPKMPRHLRLPKMEDWQFYDRVRLQELQDKEAKLFDELIEKGEAPGTGAVTKLILLPEEEHAEKTRLLAEGFGDWNRYHYSNFVKASAKYGRNQYARISEDIGRPVEDITRYANVFWSKGPEQLPATEWERVTKQIEKGEKRLEEIERLTIATARLVSSFNDPWEELTFRHVGGQGRLFNAVEDRYLLCLTHLHGYGNWDRVRSSIRRCERFRFDYYLLSCTAEALGKRCEALMRVAEREMIEIDKKQQAAADSAATVPASVTAASNSRAMLASIPVSEAGKSSAKEAAGDGASVHERMAELMRQISDEARRLAATRAELQKARKSISEAQGDRSKPSKSAASKKTSVESSIASADSSLGRNTQKASVPDSLLPDLCRILASSGPDGMSKVVNKFLEHHPHIAKRKLELKIAEISVKEKRGKDTMKMWYIKPEFEHLLDVGVASGKKKEGSSKKRKLAASEADGTPSSKSAKTTAASTGKKSTADDDINRTSPRSGKKKTAFSLFVKDKRPQVEENLGPDVDTAILKKELLDMWRSLGSSERAEYEKREAEFNSRGTKSSSDGSSKKKSKN